jgi:aminomethyltransferase
LYALHASLGGRLVTFAGYELPVQFPSGIIKEHLHTRAAAGLFDVSHMGQIKLTGAGAAAGLEALLPIDVVGLPAGRQRYGLFTNESGGILDDLMVANLGSSLLVVVNAACKDADLAHLRRHLAGRCTVEALDNRALLALQGPSAADVLGRHASQVAAMRFMDVRQIEILGAACYVSRSGYTGEDGFEVSVPADAAEEIARELLRHPAVAPVGLGARDSLRLEAGLPLYGNDLDPSTTPVEASLDWAVSKARRDGGARRAGFPGAQIVLRELAGGAARRRVGLRPEGRAPVRAGTPLFDAAGREAGIVTSGGFGATLGTPVAMGYVTAPLARNGVELAAEVRGKRVAVSVAELAAVPHRYRRGGAS